MELHSPLFLIGFLITISTFHKRAETADPLFYICSNNGGNFTANSRYNTNLNQLVFSVSNTVSNNYGFYNYSTGGKNSDSVNALALCRGDVQPDICVSCITDATIELRNRCPNRKEAIIWYDFCMFRYSSRSILGNMDTTNTNYGWIALNNVTDSDGYNLVVNNLLNNLRSIAASGGSLRKLVTGNESTPNLQTIYGLVQCTPDISEQECNDCLVNSFRLIPQCCNGKRGGRVLSPSCNFRYENARFYIATPSLPTPPPPPRPPVTTPEETKKVIIVVSIAVIAILVICILVFLRTMKSRLNVNDVDGNVDEIRSAEFLQYDFNTINVATNNFSHANKLGQGGFGAVYKGSLLNGQEVAVKRLAMNSEQGDLEFKNEVVLVAKLQHRNLVRLLGFCLEGVERLLIYEFVPNTSLDHFIFDSIKRQNLNWEKRYKIIEGIAQGLLYLHKYSRIRITHRDLKASNVLLDVEMSPKIADFGMARLMDQTQEATKRIVGTCGYMAPEYAMHGQFSAKSDIFSFGILVLEIVTGRKSYSFRNHRSSDEHLLSFVWRHWSDGTASSIVDPTILSVSRILRCIHIGLQCVQESATDRPTMTEVAQMLNNSSLTLPLPSQPTFIMRASKELSSSMSESKKSDKEDAPQSKNKSPITDIYPR